MRMAPGSSAAPIAPVEALHHAGLGNGTAVAGYGLPTRPGRYPLLLSDGRVRWSKVIEMNRELFALSGWLRLLATPVDRVDGLWLVPMEMNALGPGDWR